MSKTNKKIRFFGFDVNGTIFDDRDALFESLNSVFDHFKKPRLSAEELSERLTSPWTKIYRDAGVSEIQASETELYSLYNAAYRNQSPSQPARGILEALEWIRKRPWPTFTVIVSTQQNEITLPLLIRHKLDKYFFEVLGGVSDKADAITNFLEQHNISPEEAIYVGDQDSDMKFALGAKVIPIAHTQGAHSRERMKRAGAEFFLEHFEELPRLPIFSDSTE